MEIPTPRGRAPAYALDVAIGLATLAGLWCVTTQAVEFGSTRGNWAFRYVAEVDGRFVALACAAGALVAILHEIGRRWVETHPALAVGALFAGGLGVQLALRALHPHAMAELLVSDVANSFYAASGRVGPLELLADFDRIATRLPLHARVNMPGKVLLFHALRTVSADPATLSLLVVILSSAAGLVLYAVVARALASRSLGLDAMTLWMLLPAKAGLLPLLNVVSPLPALLVAWCFVHLLDTARLWTALALGVSAYLTVFFDPLALWLAVPFVPLVVRARGPVGRVVGLLALAVLAFLAVHVAVRVTTGFDAFDRLLRMVDFVRAFNVSENRRYDVWLEANVKDVALAVGPAVTAGFAAAFVLALWRMGHALAAAAWSRLREAGPLLTIGALAALATIVALGVNRGEVARLWIPLFVPPLAAVAWCLGESHPASRALVVAGTVAYAAVTVATVGYALP